MGGGFTCDGGDIIQMLNDAFGDPTTSQYQFAKANNIFDTVPPGQNNYRALIAAYSEAGVKISPRWGAYLRQLGQSPQGQDDIHKIAQARYKALRADVPMETSKHQESDTPRGGKHVQKHDGTGHSDPSKIDSPYPLT
jgi:hypothetical protein